MRRLSLFLMLLIGAGPVVADAYLETVPVFWKKLYPDGGESLYCGESFGRYDRRYNIEHVFPMSWVGKALRCGDRDRCRATSEQFNRIESDMHNLYPARKDLNRRRASMAYGILKGERWVEAKCDMEIDTRRRRVEPRPAVRGDIARAMLYMADRYPELRLYRKQRELLERWHRQDPVDRAERERNRKIARLQGNGNPWIE